MLCPVADGSLANTVNMCRVLMAGIDRLLVASGDDATAWLTQHVSIIRRGDGGGFYRRDTAGLTPPAGRQTDGVL